jgi:hypothetical protein
MLHVACHRYNQLLAAVSSSLQELGAAMNGLVAMSADLELVAAALRDGRVSGPCLLASLLPTPALHLPAYLEQLRVMYVCATAVAVAAHP